MPPTEATLTRLHADHAVGVYRFAWSVTKDESLAQEVVQDLFLKLARDESLITSAKSERAMIFTLTRNLAIDALRRQNVRTQNLHRLADAGADWFLPAPTPQDEEVRRQLTAALAALPEEQRSVIHLHVWEDLTFREIGELLDLPTQTVASRYRYGLEKLRSRKHNFV